MKKFVFITSIIITYSCSTLKNDYAIVNSILKNDSIKLNTLSKNESYVESIIYYENEIFNKNLNSNFNKYFFETGYELSLTPQDLKEFKYNQTIKKNIIWEKNFLKNNMIIIKPYDANKDDSKLDLPFIWLSLPVYNYKKDKAIIKYVEANSLKRVLFFLIKENNNWKVVGKMEQDLSLMLKEENKR